MILLDSIIVVKSRPLLIFSVNDDFTLIDSDNVSFFAPLDVELNSTNNHKKFSDTEYNFLLKKKCILSSKVIGMRVWDIYCSIVRNNQTDFILKAIDLKVLGGIIPKFVFSMFNSEKLLDNIKPFLEYDETEKSFKICGFYCLSPDFEQIYEYEKGLDETYLSDGVMIF